MPKIFISYSRVDREFIKPLYANLARMYEHQNVWYDDRIPGGHKWWNRIMERVAWCDIFIYVLSNESVQSNYCQAEFEEAQRLQKFVITVQARDRTRLSDELSSIQYIDMKPGVDKGDAYARLVAAIGTYSPSIFPKRALWKKRTPKPEAVPEDIEELIRKIRSDVNTPELKPAKPGKSSQFPLLYFILVTIIVALCSMVFYSSLVISDIIPPIRIFSISVDTLDTTSDVGAINTPSSTPEATNTLSFDSSVTNTPFVPENPPIATQFTTSQLSQFATEEARRFQSTVPEVPKDLEPGIEVCAITDRNLSTAAVEDFERQTGDLVRAGTIVTVRANVSGEHYFNDYYHIYSKDAFADGWFPVDALTNDLSYCDEQNLFTQTAEAATVAARGGIPIVADDLARGILVCVMSERNLSSSVAGNERRDGISIQAGTIMILARDTGDERDEHEFREFYHVQSPTTSNISGWLPKAVLTGDLSYCE